MEENQVNGTPVQPIFVLQVAAFPNGQMQVVPQGEIDELALHRIMDGAKAALLQQMKQKQKPSLLLPNGPLR